MDVVATPDLVVTVRKTPRRGTPWDPDPLEIAAARGVSVGELLFRLVDDVAASFLDVVVALDAQIDELEDHIDDWPSETVRRRVGRLRHDLLHARRTVGSMRGAVRRIVDKRLDIGDERLFPETVERMVANTYETLVGAGEELEVARDLLSSVRDYHQSVITERQNDIIKTLTVIASLVLVPTLIVGFYGQNFVARLRRGLLDAGRVDRVSSSRRRSLSWRSSAGAAGSDRRRGWRCRRSSPTSPRGTPGDPSEVARLLQGRENAVVRHGGLGAGSLSRSPDTRPRRPRDRCACGRDFPRSNARSPSTTSM